MTDRVDATLLEIDPSDGVTSGSLPGVAWRPVGFALAAVAVLLAATSNGYGFHRDELYFRMLPAQWGYVDQPPFTPLLVRALSSVVDEPWAIRVPATVSAVLAGLVVVLLTRELGGGRLVQGLAAWGYVFAVFPLIAGHLMSTASYDVVMWLAAILAVVRAVLRRDPRWWLACGLVLGLATYNKLLVVLLVVALAAGFSVAGPWRLPWRWVVAGAGIALVLSVPAIVYQVSNGWPQLAMGRALIAKNGAGNRAALGPFLLVLLGPLLVPTWVAGWVALLRRQLWRPVRFLGVAFPAVVLLTFLTGGQGYYVLGVLGAVYAAGCVPIAEWMARGRWRAAVTCLAVILNSLVAAVIALPLVPLSALGASGIPGLNSTVGDQVGWPAYVAQVGQAYRTLAPQERHDAVVITSNYGEAGAIERFGPALGLPHAISGHNELFLQARPPQRPVTVVVVGRGAGSVAAQNATCTIVVRLDNGVGVGNEEQGQPVAVCRAAREPWSSVWPRFRHLD